MITTRIIPIIFYLFVLIYSSAIFAVASIEITEPRQFGYVLGDVFSRKLKLKFTEDQTVLLDEKKTVGRINNWLSIRKVDSKQLSNFEHLIKIQYQVVNVPTKPLMIVVPGFEVKTLIGKSQKKIQSEELLVTLAPITPKIVANRGGLANIQPNNLIPAIQTKKTFSRILLWVSLLIIPVLVLIYSWAPWQKLFFTKKYPFSIAYLKLIKLEDLPDLVFWNTALMLFHNAFNSTAKKTVFVGSLDDFFLENIKYKCLSKEIRNAYNCSRKFFYENETPTNIDEKKQLIKLMHKMALIEKNLD